MSLLSRLRLGLLSRPSAVAAAAAHRGTASSNRSSSNRRASSMGKRKVDSDDEVALEPEDLEDKPKKKRASSGKKQAFTEPFVDKEGWHVEPPSLIWKSFGDPEGSTKIAAFDLDSTLVNRKSNAMFARDASDWKWWNKNTPKKLGELVEEGYKIVIFTNQGSIKSALDGKAKEKVEGMVQLMYDDIQAKNKGSDVPLQCFMAPSMADGDTCRKPATGMWDFMVENCNDGVKPDLKSSFFVGDADGSSTAHSDSDKKFAAAVGVSFKTPGEFFGPVDGKVAIDREAVKAAALAVESGDNPNADLVMQLRDLGDQAIAASKGGDPKLAFKGRAYKNAADSLSLFPDQVSESNLKAVNALKNVGKGTMERIKQYLKAGTVKLPEELDEEAAAGGPAAAAGGPSKPSANQQKEAFAFM